MSSIGSDVRVGKLKVLESISFDDGTMLTATNVYIQDKLTLGPNIVVQGLDDTYCTDAELANVADRVTVLENNESTNANNAVGSANTAAGHAGTASNAAAAALSSESNAAASANAAAVSALAAAASANAAASSESNAASSASTALGLKTATENAESNAAASANAAAVSAANAVASANLAQVDFTAITNDISSNSSRITVVESELSNVSANVSNLSSNLSNIESDLAESIELFQSAINGNSSAQTQLIVAGSAVGGGIATTMFGALKSVFQYGTQKATQTLVDNTRSTIAEVFGSNNFDNITTSNGFSSTYNSNIAQLQQGLQLVRSHMDTTSVRQAKINGNSSNIASLQSNTAQLATTLGIHNSNISSLNQSIITIETDLGNVQAEVNTLQTDLTSNVSRIANTETNLASNVSRISSLESSSVSGLFTNTITSQRANGQAAALYARDTNSPDRADNVEYNYVLNAPRPGTTTGGIDLFINSANRTNDGGASTATLRNANGNLRLGNPSYDTILEGSNISVSSNVGIGTANPLQLSLIHI